MTNTFSSTSAAHDNYQDDLPGSAEHDRLRLAVRGASAEHFDGIWWPTSTTLTSELQTLLPAVRERLGAVAAVGYRIDDWTDAPAHVDIGDGVPVELLGFTGHAVPSVLVIGQDGRHLRLRIIDPATDPQHARQTLHEMNSRDTEPAEDTSQPSRSIADVAKSVALHEGRNDAARDAEILRWCHEAAAQFDNARIQAFVPLLVDHIITDRIHREQHAANTSNGGAVR